MQKNNFYCDVCEIKFSTAGEYALHEFSKKHCNNLLKVAKNKKVPKKQKVKEPQEPPPAKEPQQWSVIPGPGTITQYGYIVPGVNYGTMVRSREFNTNYDPYQQKYAENPNREAYQVPLVRPIEPLEEGINSLKRKRRNLRTCQICNLMFLTVPEYEAHMKSPQHVLNLKSSGKGVTAHFVKATTDLHTVKTEERSKERSESAEAPANSGMGTSHSGMFPILYCDVCELLLNSEQQFNAHVNGKSHNENVQRKAEIRAKKQLLESPSPNQLYCFSCKVSLNNLYQYNEHKYGKKHHLKCRRLMKLGITIPPEERVASWGTPRLDPNMRVIYPELYEKYILERDKNKTLFERRETSSENTNQDFMRNLIPVKCDSLSSSENQESNKKGGENIEPVDEHLPRMMSNEEVATNFPVFSKEESNEGKEKHIIGANDVLKCSICALDFEEQINFDDHLVTGEHWMKIVEAKEKGMKDYEILSKLLEDRNVVKPDKFGRLACSTCSITASNYEEFTHHISSLVHKESEQDYKKKRAMEIESAIKPDKYGKYTCKTCNENSKSLIEYNRHLLTSKHRDTFRTEKNGKTRRVSLLKRVKQKYKISGLKRKDFACWRKKCEENPGVKTKTLDSAEGLDAGHEKSIPVSEASKPETEANIGEGILNRGTKRKSDDPGNTMREIKRAKPNIRQEYYIKPMMPRPYIPRPPPHLPLRYPRPMFPRNWVFYPPNPFRPMAYPHRPNFPMSRYPRPPGFQPPWPGMPRYPPCYN